MARRMQSVDVALVGGGMTASILGKHLAEAGSTVVALERGDMRQTIPDFQSPTMHDELKHSIRHALMQNPAVQTLSFRNFPRPAGAADAPARFIPAGRGRGRRDGALERADLALPAGMVRAEELGRTALRPRTSSART